MEQNDNFSGESLSYEQIQELLPGFAVGALSVHEMQAVERYLQQHEQLIQQRYDLELTSQALAYSAPPQRVPDSVKRRLMERVRADVASAPETAPPRHSPLTGNPAAATPVPPLASRPAKRSGALPLFPEQVRRQSPWVAWAQGLIGVAAVAATAVLLVANWQLQSQSAALSQQVAAVQQQWENTQQSLQQKETELATVQSRVDETTTQLRDVQSQIAEVQRDAEELKTANTSLQETIAQQSDQINTLTTANRLLTLAGLGEAQSANGTFFVSNGTVVLSLRGLPPVPDGKTYQLWYLPEGGTPAPADLFQVQSGDTTLLTFTIPSAVTDFANVGVSIEPAGGSQSPTDVVLLSST